MRPVIRDPFGTGARADECIRERLHAPIRSRFLLAVFCYLVFEALTPFVLLVDQRLWRIAEGVGFAVVATVVTWLVRRLA